ncbi:hypothetical protein N7456_013409 [Penicillium angulare]|uniref:Uncharacterized protein n=1 Tax=Penicillium angulare TaxID=116970 RepID=A0A9W9EG56_9EURO|nr:hypothetical protein N7456_013409 [Penicillium angulare]
MFIQFNLHLLTESTSFRGSMFFFDDMAFVPDIFMLALAELTCIVRLQKINYNMLKLQLEM